MHLNWKLVALHALIVFALTILGGFSVGFITSISGTPAPLTVLAITNLVFASAGFAYAAYKTREKRWAHLSAVALVLWIFSLMNLVLGFATFLEWALSLIVILVFMLVGGGTGILIEKFKKK